MQGITSLKSLKTEKNNRTALTPQEGSDLHPMNHLTQHQLDRLKQQLLQERDRLAARLKENSHYGMPSSMRDSAGDLSVNDNHPADLGTEMFERGKDLALNENAEQQLDEMNAALQAFGQGRYGRCLACNEPIPYERLEAMPATLYCVNHAPNPHINGRRPREEQLLDPPFGRTSLDERDGQNQFDGEDAWQIVESWGNSDSPAMAEDPQISDYEDMHIEADESDGFVQPIDSFLATDLYGKQVSVVRNRAYRNYMKQNEGEPLLEPDPALDTLDTLDQ